MLEWLFFDRYTLTSVSFPPLSSHTHSINPSVDPFQQTTWIGYSQWTKSPTIFGHRRFISPAAPAMNPPRWVAALPNGRSNAFCKKLPHLLLLLRLLLTTPVLPMLQQKTVPFCPMDHLRWPWIPMNIGLFWRVSWISPVLPLPWPGYFCFNPLFVITMWNHSNHFDLYLYLFCSCIWYIGVVKNSIFCYFCIMGYDIVSFLCLLF